MIQIQLTTRNVEINDLCVYDFVLWIHSDKMEKKYKKIHDRLYHILIYYKKTFNMSVLNSPDINFEATANLVTAQKYRLLWRNAISNKYQYNLSELKAKFKDRDQSQKICHSTLLLNVATVRCRRGTILPLSASWTIERHHWQNPVSIKPVTNCLQRFEVIALLARSTHGLSFSFFLPFSEPVAKNEPRGCIFVFRVGEKRNVARGRTVV